MKNGALYFRILVFSLILSSCVSYYELAEQAGKDVLDDSTVIEYESTACFGSCPVYKVTIYGSGKIEYVGQRHVCKQENIIGEISKDEVNRLVVEMLESNFFSIKNYTEYFVTDSPTMKMSLKYKNKFHKVEHYAGDDMAPIRLDRLEKMLNNVAVEQGWVGTSNGKGRVCKMPDGTESITLYKDMHLR